MNLHETFTSLALELDKCQRYDPALLERVLKRSTQSLNEFKVSRTKHGKRKRIQSSTAEKQMPMHSFPPLKPSLSTYLNQPDMVRHMLDELNPQTMQSQRSDTEVEPTAPKMKVCDEEAELGTDTSKVVLASNKLTQKLPIIKVITPRTRQRITRLPPPRDEDLAAINQLESVANESLARKLNTLDNIRKPHSLYGSLQKKMKCPTKPSKSAKRYLVVKHVNDTRNENIEMMREEDHDVLSIVRTALEESSQMQQDDVNVTLVLCEWSKMISEDRDTASYESPRKQALHHIALELDHKKTLQLSMQQPRIVHDANETVISTIDSIKRFVPLDLIYSHGQGGYASMKIQQAMDIVHLALLRICRAQYLFAWHRWVKFCDFSRTREKNEASITIQCVWRVHLAHLEANIRREIRSKQREREQYLLRRLANKRDDAAKCITRNLRRYKDNCIVHRKRKLHLSAFRIQLFMRSRWELWGRFARFLQNQRREKAASRIQTCIRAHQSRAKARLERKLCKVARQNAALLAEVEAQAHALRLVGATLTVQRNFRRRRAARRAKFGAMRRRHAKKVAAAIKIQSIARMYLAIKLRMTWRTKIDLAAVVLQCAYRCYMSCKKRKTLRQEMKEKKKQRLAMKKELRREKRQRQKTKESASQAKKFLMLLEDNAKTLRPKWKAMEPGTAAKTIQSTWRGYKVRKRIQHQQAKETEQRRRGLNRKRKKAATIIQRHVRGMLGRIHFWRWRVNEYARSIQRLFRNRKARRDIAFMRAYAKAALLIQRRWLQKKSFVVFRKQRRAAVVIQATIRMATSKRRYIQKIQAHHVLEEMKQVGSIQFTRTTLVSIQLELLQLSWKYSYDSKQPHSQVHVKKILYKRDDNGVWTSGGCFGLWQVLFLELCRHGNTSDASEIDNMRFSRFLKEIPGMLHKTHCPLQNVDVAFAKFKPAKGRTMLFAGFHKAMAYLLALRYPDKPPVQYTMEQRFLMFMQQLFLVSKFGENYRLRLTEWAIERSTWAAHVLQTFVRHRQQQRRHQAFVMRFLNLRKIKEEHDAAILLQAKWRQRLAKMKFQSFVCDAFVEYVDWKSGARSYRNLITNTSTYSRPALLRGLNPSVSIKLPPPGEEYVVTCTRHETEPVELATTYCLDCEEAMCLYCFDRDHKRKAFADHESTPVYMCSLCDKHTATRTCNQCHDGQTPYCDTCYPHYHHKTSKFAAHTFTPLVYLCNECGEKVGRWKCMTCTDLFCKKCFSVFHRKGQRQTHAMEAVPYLAMEAKEAQDKRQRQKEAAQAEAERELRAQKAQVLEEQKRELAAIMIQSAFRSKRDRDAGKAYMKMVRQTERMVHQRLKDDVVRNAFAYKLRKVVGLAPILASDTADEVKEAIDRKELIVNTLGLATYDHTKGPPPWCVYNAPVSIVHGEYKSLKATVLSTSQLVSSGLVMIHVTEANKSMNIPLIHIKPIRDVNTPSKAAQVVESLGGAVHKLHVNVLDRVEQKRLELKIFHHRTDFKEIEEYAWIEQKDLVTAKIVWWNVVSNGKTNNKPLGVKAMETMEPSAREDMMIQIQEAQEKLVMLLSKSDRGAARRRDSIDTIFNEEHLQAMNESNFWHDSLWSHPRVGKKARDLVKELTTDSLRRAVQLLSKVKEIAADDTTWEKVVLKFCSLPKAEKLELLNETAEMPPAQALSVLNSLINTKKKETTE